MIASGQLTKIGDFPAMPCFSSEDPTFSRYDHAQYTMFPGFCDVHVHLREPGFSYKETIRSGTLAAAHGGYTAVCAMPNLKPVPDSPEHLRAEQDLIRREAVIDVYPYAAISVGELGQELADLEGLAPSVIAFSDDGHGVQSEGRMREAMLRAKDLGRMIVAHCEDNSLLHGGYIHQGTYARQHGHAGICSESEWRQIERDLRLADETGCAYHVCHISTKESAELIRDAKKSHVDVSCETAPHYLLLDETFLREDGRFKMNPPLRSPRDREAMVEALLDGTVDMIATDHAPHSAEEKARGLKDSAFGIVGLETAFPLLYSGLVLKGYLSLELLVDLLTTKPRRRFRIPIGEDFSIWDLNARETIDPNRFLSKGKSTPFEGWPVSGKCVLTVHNREVIWEDKEVWQKERT